MKVHLLSENLQKKLSFLNHGVSAKSQLPILLHFLLVAKEGKLSISATDLEIGIQIEIPVEVEEEGATTVPAKIFTELINSIPSEKISLILTDNTLTVKTKKTKSIFPTIINEEFPKIYEDTGEEVATFEVSQMKQIFGTVAFAASTDIGRPQLTGVLLQKEEAGLLLVATDGYRLSLKRHHVIGEKENPSLVQKPILIPARVLREVVALKQEDKGSMHVFVSEKNNQILFKEEGMVIASRLIGGEFPSYQKIIPNEFATSVVFNKEELQKAIKICAIFARDTANIVRLTLRKGSIQVSANTPSVGENTVEIEAEHSGEENDIAFNARYLLDLFANIESEEMVFEMTGPLNPGVFKIKGDNSFLHIIMPIRVQA